MSGDIVITEKNSQARDVRAVRRPQLGPEVGKRDGIPVQPGAQPGDEKSNGLGRTNCIGHLYFTSPGQSRRNNIFGHPTHCVSSRPIHF